MKRSPTSEAGFISLGLIRVLLPIVLLWAGGQGLYTVVTNREPYSITFADYTRTRPDKSWLELKESQLDLLGAISSKSLHDISEVYIPMHAPNEPGGAKIQALLLTRDAATIALVKELRALPDEKAVMDFAMKNRERVFPLRAVRGLTQFGIDSDSRKRRKIAKLDADLTEDFAVIEEGKKPEILLAIGLFAGAFPAAWLCWFRRKGGSATQGQPAVIPPPLPK